MQDTFRTLTSEIGELFDAFPDGTEALTLMILAVVMAVILYRVALRIGRRLGLWHPVLGRIVEETRGPAQLAFVMFALRVTAAAAPLPEPAGAMLARGLQVAFIVLLGWIALTALSIGVDVYQRRFRLDVEDNLLARKHVTQIRIFSVAVRTLIVVLTVAAALMSFEQVRQFGVSLLASAGIAGIVAGLAARPLFSSLFAGVQIAMTQPLRLDDAIFVENEMGYVEEIGATYVVVRLWDWRRMILPLSYFIEKPFQNWTREGSQLIGSVFLYVDYSAPIDELRTRYHRLVKASPLWDGKVLNFQVTKADADGLELRGLCSARNSGAVFDLQCEIREKLIAFLQAEYPHALPHRRQEAIETSPSLAPAHPGESRPAQPARGVSQGEY